MASIMALLKTLFFLWKNIKSSKGFYPTPKLIEAYQITNGFSIRLIGNIGVTEEPPQENNGDNNLKRTINQTKSKQEQLPILERGFYSEPVKPVIPVKNDVSNTEQQLKVVTEESGLRRLEVNQDFEKSALEESDVSGYNQLACFFCGKGIMDNDWVQNDFSGNKPAHKRCYDEKREQSAHEGALSVVWLTRS